MASRSCLALRPCSSVAALVGMICFLVSAAAWAKSSASTAPSQTCLQGVLCVFNEGGTATGGAAGLTMNGMNGSLASTVFQIGSLAATGNLSLTTGALTSGTLGSTVLGNVVTFGTGTLTITTNGWNNFSGTLFTGSLSGIDWIYTGRSGKFYDYTLSGFVSGTWGPNGSTVTGQTTQLFFNSLTPYKGGAISLSSGSTGLVVPEQATFGLMGTGLFAVGFLFRRKARNPVKTAKEA